MCGIAGFFGSRNVGPDTVQAMQARLAPRGPDAQHVVRWDANLAQCQDASPHALLHARLAIIDPRPSADQPMPNQGNDVWICYNGEVYGWEQDAQALEAQGFMFRTRSDTEFILNAYQAWGIEKTLDRLRGMFAFAILDLRSRKLHLARDRMGKKPLLYSQGNGEFGFASTLRALLPWLPQERRGLSAEGIDAYLAHRYIPSPRTVFQHVRRLPNGHRLEVDLTTREAREVCYWQPQALTGDWASTLDEAVRLRTVADRPVGLFLSGGIDSTLLATRLSILGYTQISAFTAAFPGSRFDEAGDAEKTARALGLPHHAVEVPTSIRDYFSRIVADLDEPFADPSSFPLWFLARETTRHVKVVLGGDGGDELFAGYKRYGKHLRSAWRRRWQLSPMEWPKVVEPSRWQYLRGEMGMTWEDAYSLRFSGMHPGLRRLLQPGLKNMPNTYWRGMSAHANEPVDELLEIDMANYLPEYILRKGDLTTMAHGLELRAPLLDQAFYQHTLGLPRALRFTQPAKLALQPLCQPCQQMNLFAKKKRGFNPPLTAWLRDDLGERFDGLGSRLAESSAGLIAAAGADLLGKAYLDGQENLAENALQLLILDESLRQLTSP